MELSRAEIKERILDLVPKVCPSCGKGLILSEDLQHLYCPNPSCSGKLYRRIEIMAKAFGIENIGIKVAQELVEYLDLKAEHELFDLSVEDFLRVPRYQRGMAEKLYNSVHSGKKVTWASFIRGCQFLRVGEGTANEMAQKYPTVDSLFEETAKGMARKMDGMTENLTSQIVNSIQQRKEEVLALKERVTLGEESNTITTGTNLIKYQAVVTGPLNFGSRPEFQNHFGASYGIKWASAVSGNTDILVTNETTPTGKYKKAKELQAAGGKIKIMSEEEFIKFLGGDSVAEDRLQTTAQQMKTLDMFGGMEEITL